MFEIIFSENEYEYELFKLNKTAPASTEDELVLKLSNIHFTILTGHSA
jgi:hypothetical protein